jgi:uncharacterized protein YndB with AHSA1/START domain
MPESRDGTLVFDDVFASVVVRFERTLPYPPKRVWEWLVDREHLTEWLTTETGGHIRHRPGGEVFLPTIGGAVIVSEVIEFIPENTLCFGWETFNWVGGVVCWLFDRVNEDTKLTFEHSDDDLGPEHFARSLANWHLTLDLFEASLAGTPKSWDWDAWEAQVRRYTIKLAHLVERNP